MKEKTFKVLLALLVLGLMLGAAPARSLHTEPELYHSMDNALLLMFSSHMRLNGEVESALIPPDQGASAHLAAVSSQTQADIENEINAVIDLYVTMIANLQASGNYSRQVEEDLVAQMNEKVDALQAKAQALAVKRSRRRGGFLRGIVRVLNRVIKATGRGVGRVMGKAMDGAGKVAQFAIEEVGPKALEESLMGGVSLNWKLFRRVGRDILKKRGVKAAENFVLRLAQRIADRQRAEGEAVPSLDAVAQATQDAWDKDFMEAFEEGDEGDQSDQSPTADSGDDLDLSPQERAAEGMHTYMIINTTNGETDAPASRKMEYEFTATGVDLYTDGHVYIYTYPRIGPNQYVWGGGQAILTFTDEGSILQHTDGSRTSVATRID